jgi:hypothetical protein
VNCGRNFQLDTAQRDTVKILVQNNRKLLRLCVVSIKSYCVQASSSKLLTILQNIKRSESSGAYVIYFQKHRILIAVSYYARY